MATIFAPFDQVTPEEFKRATEVTYLGYVYGALAALKRMKPRDRGVIVQVGSALAYRSIPLQSAYCGAKRAVVGFTDSIRSELLHDGSNVHITVAHLPAMNTPQFEWSRSRMPRHPQPVPPILQPEVAARAIVWAARHRRREARYLRELRLEIQGEPPFPCSLADVAANELEFTYVYPEKEGGGSDRGGEHRGITYGNLDLRLHYRVRPCGLMATLWITNHWQELVEVDVAWALAADFADMGELHGARRQQAEVEVVAQPNGVKFRYRHPEIPMETRIFAEGGGAWAFADGRLAARVLLERQSTVELRLSALAVDAQDPLDEDEAERREERLREWQRSVTRVEAAGETLLAEITNRAMRELGAMALLEGREDEWLTPSAGMPGFPSLWGRDALTAVWQASIFDRGQMAAAVLTRLERLQGQRADAWRHTPGLERQRERAR